MSDQSYVLFALGYSCYGIPTSVVQELFFLPEVSPGPGAAPFMVGIINLRGSILPIVDLQRRLGHQSSPYELTNSIIVVQWQNHQVGLLVDQVHEVQAIAEEHIRSGLVYEQWQVAEFQRFVTGVASLDTTLVTLLNPEELVRSADLSILSDLGAEDTVAKHLNNNNGYGHGGLSERTIVNQPTTGATNLFAHLSSADQQVLRARSENLRLVANTQDIRGIPVTVVGLEGEYFGLNLDTVHEFTDIHKVTPVPCCPPHILGNMNLRGEIVTLVDISQAINLSMTSAKSRHKAIVVRLDELVAGIAVDQILDVIYLDPLQISTAAIAIHTTADEYLQGFTSYQDKMISIINLSKLLTSDVLVVNEEL